ncbi:hypothetical protein BDN72DRAFT_899996 [Pluteus cervinus]|uniref:Uncharacterized protein n=1 Tax=Pluteus cervinus TaxID=181527 RepID=A0ACD3AKH1_9AGAR|nr:hypothetical protein BDN72DRAFT_899996 [Pluteus cervinus]
MFGISSTGAFALLFLASGAIAGTLPRQNSDLTPIFQCNKDLPCKFLSFDLFQHILTRLLQALMDSDAVVPCPIARMANASLRPTPALFKLTKMVNY